MAGLVTGDRIRARILVAAPGSAVARHRLGVRWLATAWEGAGLPAAVRSRHSGIENLRIYHESIFLCAFG